MWTIIKPIIGKYAVVNEINLIVATQITRQAGAALKPVVDEICQVVPIDYGGTLEIYPADVFSPGPAAEVAISVDGDTVIVCITGDIRVEVEPADIFAPGVAG